MRIALTIRHFDIAKGGAEGFATRVVAALVQRGYTIQVFAESGDAESAELTVGPLSAAMAAIAAGNFDLHLDWGLNTPADLHRLGGGVHRAFMKYNTLSVHPLLRLYKHLEQWLSPKHVHIRKREQKLLSRNGASFLAVSEFVADQLCSTFDISRDRVFTLVNGVPIDRFSFNCRIRFRNDIRHVLGLDDSHIAFLFVANNPRLKNLALVRRLFQEFHQRVPTARLIVMGRRRPKFAAPWLIDAGHVSMPERIYSAADILLHPTFYDACANVVLESMACGCPVISSTFNGSAEVINHGVNGYVIPVAGKGRREIERGWYDAMMALAEDSGFRRRMGRSAAATIRGRHTMDNYLDRLEPILKQVVGY